MIVLSRFQNGSFLTPKGLEFLNNAELIIVSLPPIPISNIHPLSEDDVLEMLAEVTTEIKTIREVSSPTLYTRLVDEIIDFYVEDDNAEVSIDTDIDYQGKRNTDPLPKLLERLNFDRISAISYREGVIDAASRGYPTAYPTVDIAILRGDKILLARKPNEVMWRFVGGFADPDSDSYEENAIREVQEETGLLVSDLEYIGSFAVDEWRYRPTHHSMKTILFLAESERGEAVADDDIEEVKWVHFDQVVIEDLVPNHQRLFRELEKYLRRKNKAI